ncbi:TolB family protein [Paenibacillus hexagrammi]|uniref:Uncharacterized protein n=1 Tax=Paenibacillus hexagrammi TaxID=2908839 RepID=A0ABY3SM29_9BACL|nr:hypothetical protein [Paenibacillus sp. YPD9-1]UJF34017.1 hypothetical protein L0M14_01900 [Paenibacillus sp. YPD9-1]
MGMSWLKKKRKASAGLMLSVLLLTGIVPQGVFADSAGQMASAGLSVQDSVYGSGGQSVAIDPSSVPVLDPLGFDVTNAHQVTISGTAKPGASVRIWYSLNEEETSALGEPAIADENGRFTVDVSLDDIGYGTYNFSASSIVDGQESAQSEPIMLEVDWIDAGYVFDVEWSLLTSTLALLSWSPPMVEGNPDPIPNPDIAGYRVYDDTAGVKLRDTTETQLTVPITAGAEMIIRITTVDHAGNESSGTTVTIASSTDEKTKLAELNKPASDAGFEAVLSGDGSTAVYTDAPASTEEQRLVFMVRKGFGGFMEKDMFSPTKEDSGLPNGSIHSLRVDETGDRVVFISNATNLTASPEQAGEHVYVYDKKRSGLELLSTPGVDAREPGISRDGRYVVFSENGRIYLIDRNADPSERRKLISETVDGSPENGTSTSAAISGDGKKIAFVSSSRNIKGMPAPYPGVFIYLYDVSQGVAVNRFADHNRYDHLEMDDAGKHIAYNSGYSFNRDDAYVMDVDTGIEMNVNGSRSVWNNSYDKVMITGDGKQVLAQLTETPSDRIKHYSELFQLSDPGNPTIPAGLNEDTFGAAIDRAGKRMIYGQENALYAACLADCDSTDPGSTLESAQWSVVNQVDDQLMAGGIVTLEAGGTTGQSVEAVISYRTAGSDEVKQKTVTMSEQPASPGYYKATFTLDDTIAEIVSGVVQLEGGTSRITLDRFPVKVAGVLSVHVQTDKTDRLGGLELFAVDGNGVEKHKDMSSNVLDYQLPLKSGAVYTVGIRYGEAVLVKQEGVTLAGGRTTALNLTPEFSSTLKVLVNEPTGQTRPAGIKVKFTPEGMEPVMIDIDSKGIAALPGKLPEGTSVTVEVVPPVGYKTGGERVVPLNLGENEISFDLFSILDSVTKVEMKYDKTVGQGSDTVPVMGSTATLVVTGKLDLSLQAAVISQQWKDGKQERVETPIDLSETEQGGSYTGTYLVTEGTASIESVEILIGSERLPEPFAIHKNVAGRLNVTLDVPEGKEWQEWRDPFQGSIVEVMYMNDKDYMRRHYDWKQIKDNVWSYGFDVPYNNLSYRVLLSYGSSLVPMDLNAPEFDFGQTAELKITPKYFVRISGDIKGPKGERVRSDYALTDSDGNVVLQGNTYGSYDLRVTAVKDQEYTLKVIPNDVYYLPKEIKVSANKINVGANVSVETKPSRKLEGTVTGNRRFPGASRFRYSYSRGERQGLPSLYGQGWYVSYRHPGR